MPVLMNAPLVYTIGMVRFPRIPDAKRFVDPFLDHIRDGYPLYEEMKQIALQGQVGPQGLQLSHQEIGSWQFASPDGKWAFVFSEAALFLHTCDYQGFDDFRRRFEFGITQLLAVPGIKLEWMTGAGFRYIDLVEPRKGELLTKYLEKWVLPSEPPSHPMHLLEGVYAIRCKTDVGELRFQALRNPPYTLPPELVTPAMTKMGWLRPRPESEFALIDTDHGVEFEKPLALTAQTIGTKLAQLRGLAREVFDSFASKHAYEIWRGKK